MHKLHFTRQATRDLLQIQSYITDKSGSSFVAARFIQKLRAQCRKLSALPGQMGQERPDLPRQLRSFPFGNYHIIFRYRDNYFEIASIVERHRDLGALFEEEP